MISFLKNNYAWEIKNIKKYCLVCQTLCVSLTADDSPKLIARVFSSSCYLYISLANL